MRKTFHCFCFKNITNLSAVEKIATWLILSDQGYFQLKKNALSSQVLKG